MAQDVSICGVPASAAQDGDPPDVRARLAGALNETLTSVRSTEDLAIRIAFLERALKALVIVVTTASGQVMEASVGAGSDLEALTKALLSPDVLDVLKQADPLILARLQGVAAREQILQAEGGTWSAQAVAQRLGVDDESVDKLRQSGHLLGIPAGEGDFRYPAWQFGADGPLPGLETVLMAMGVRSPWMRAAFFLSGDLTLSGETPLAALRRGDIEAVTRAAVLYGEQGAA